MSQIPITIQLKEALFV